MTARHSMDGFPHFVLNTPFLVILLYASSVFTVSAVQQGHVFGGMLRERSRFLTRNYYWQASWEETWTPQEKEKNEGWEVSYEVDCADFNEDYDDDWYDRCRADCKKWAKDPEKFEDDWTYDKCRNNPSLAWIHYYSSSVFPADRPDNCHGNAPLSSGFEGTRNSEYQGIMFDVRVPSGPTNSDVRIYAFDLNLDGEDESHEIQVYTRYGSHLGYENDFTAWTDLGVYLVHGQDEDNPSHLSLNETVVARVGDVRAFYFAQLNSDEFKVFEIDEDDVGAVLVSDGTLQILVGTGKDEDSDNPFEDDNEEGAGFSGTIYYDTCENTASSQYATTEIEATTEVNTPTPTEAPTPIPTAAPTVPWHCAEYWEWYDRKCSKKGGYSHCKISEFPQDCWDCKRFWKWHDTGCVLSNGKKNQCHVRPVPDNCWECSDYWQWFDSGCVVSNVHGDVAKDCSKRTMPIDCWDCDKYIEWQSSGCQTTSGKNNGNCDGRPIPKSCTLPTTSTTSTTSSPHVHVPDMVFPPYVNLPHMECKDYLQWVEAGCPSTEKSIGDCSRISPPSGCSSLALETETGDEGKDKNIADIRDDVIETTETPSRPIVPSKSLVLSPFTMILAFHVRNGKEVHEELDLTAEEENVFKEYVETHLKNWYRFNLNTNDAEIDVNLVLRRTKRGLRSSATSQGLRREEVLSTRRVFSGEVVFRPTSDKWIEPSQSTMDELTRSAFGAPFEKKFLDGLHLLGTVLGDHGVLGYVTGISVDGINSTPSTENEVDEAQTSEQGEGEAQSIGLLLTVVLGGVGAASVLLIKAYHVFNIKRKESCDTPNPPLKHNHSIREIMSDADSGTNDFTELNASYKNSDSDPGSPLSRQKISKQARREVQEDSIVLKKSNGPREFNSSDDDSSNMSSIIESSKISYLDGASSLETPTIITDEDRFAFSPPSYLLEDDRSAIDIEDFSTEKLERGQGENDNGSALLDQSRRCSAPRRFEDVWDQSDDQCSDIQSDATVASANMLPSHHPLVTGKERAMGNSTENL